MLLKRRNTIQKQLVYSAVTQLSTHPTADEVYAHICRAYPDISRGTVYRNLNQLAQDGEILKIPVPGGADRFDFNQLAHYHILCIRCGSFEDVSGPYLHCLDKRARQETGFSSVTHSVVFQGVCASCMRLEKSNKKETVKENQP